MAMTIVDTKMESDRQDMSVALHLLPKSNRMTRLKIRWAEHDTGRHHDETEGQDNIGMITIT